MVLDLGRAGSRLMPSAPPRPGLSSRSPQLRGNVIALAQRVQLRLSCTVERRRLLLTGKYRKIQQCSLRNKATATSQHVMRLLANSPVSEFAQYSKKLDSWVTQWYSLMNSVPYTVQYKSLITSIVSDRLSTRAHSI